MTLGLNWNCFDRGLYWNYISITMSQIETRFLVEPRRVLRDYCFFVVLPSVCVRACVRVFKPPPPANNEDLGLKFLPYTYDHTLTLYTKLMTFKGQSSRSRQGYIGLARCCYISKTEPHKFCIISFHINLSDTKITRQLGRPRSPANRFRSKHHNFCYIHIYWI